MSEKTFAVSVVGDNTSTSAVLKKSQLRVWLSRAFYGENVVPDQDDVEKKRWEHFVAAKNWQRDVDGGPFYYEYYDGECTIRAFRVPS